MIPSGPSVRVQLEFAKLSGLAIADTTTRHATFGLFVAPIRASNFSSLRF